MSPEELRRRLKELEDVSKISELALNVLAEKLTLLEFPARTLIFEEGTFHPWFYLIASGQVTLEMNATPRGRKPVLTLGPGDILAWSALLGDGHMTTSAVSATDSQLLAISSGELKKLLENNEQLSLRLHREVAAALAKRLVATRLQLLDLFNTSTN
jgi:CRP/FNR family transcriptional regulator, cyclic AMP receptor protein